MTEPDGVLLLRKAVAGAVAELVGQRRLTVVELAAEGIVVWQLRRDSAHVPVGRSLAVVPWHELYNGVIPAQQAVVRAARVEHDATVILVSTFPEQAQNTEAFEWIRAIRDGVQSFVCDVDLAGLFREVISDDPLTHMYELVTLTERPSGRLELGCTPLFPIGSQRGATEDLVVRCAGSDGRGTAFAVVASHQHERLFRPVLVQSVDLVPGIYRLQAELVRPGVVRFNGLPSEPVRDTRTWTDLVAALPAKLSRPTEETHLICAVEISGSPAQVNERISRTGQLVAMAAEAAGRVSVSLISYGPHGFHRTSADAPVTFLRWVGSAEQVLSDLRRLADRGAVTEGYPHAAQLECVLTQVADRLDHAEPAGRTSLLVIGDRPAFPPRRDPSEILPCPKRHDWEAALRSLRARRDLVIAAICDRPPERADPIWHRLGGGSPHPLEAVDLRGLGVDFGLVVPTAHPVPFPLIETE